MLLFAVAFTGALFVQTLFFIIATLKNRVDIIDVAWGLSFISASLFMLFFSSTVTVPTAIIIGLITIWGIRLTFHISRRFVKSNTQDKRYTDLIAKWPLGYRSLQIFFRLFVVQAFLAAVIILPLIAALTASVQLSYLTYVGVAVWLIGFAVESIADYQLRRHLHSNNRNTLMTYGLWKYSRNPNYFGEIMMWWGIAIVSFHPSTWLWSFVGAYTITLILCFVSGVPLAEKSLSNKKGRKLYKRTASALIPLPLKNYKVY